MFEYLSVVAATVSVIVATVNYFIYKKQKRKLKDNFLKLIESYSKYLGSEELISAKNLAKSQQVLSDLLTSATKSLRELYGKKMFASVKLIEKQNGEVYAVTFARDGYSSYHREMFKYKYPIKYNTAYSSLLNDKKGNNYFLSNDIKDLSEGGYYNTTNNDWKNLYKSVLVIPIVGQTKKDILGFLVFDSPEKNAFSKEVIEFIDSISRLVAKIIEDVLSNADVNEHSNIRKENRLIG